MKPECELLIGLIRSQVAGIPCEVPEGADFQALLELARSHKLMCFLNGALGQRTDVPQAVRNALEDAENRAIFKDIQNDFVRGQITEVLTAAGIRHVYLRGICLKHDYPVPALRTMSDIDLLVRSEDFSAIRQAMLKIGAEPREGDGNHRTYYFPDAHVTVEFHPNLIHCSSPMGIGVNPGWQYVPEGQQAGEQFMTEAGFYLNVMAHLANHFAMGGVGVRFVLDIWVCRHLRGTQPDRAFVEAELERIGLTRFARLIEELAEAWFSGTPMSSELEELADYIMTSGSHGTTDREMLNAVSLSPGKSRLSALMGKVFYPRQDLENRFDWVRGRAWLLPAAWCARAWKAVTGKGERISRWRKGTKTFSKAEIEAHKQKMNRFGVECPPKRI